MQLDPTRHDAQPQRGPVVLLTAGGPMAAALANGLAHRFGTLVVLQEDAESAWALVRRRARRLGWLRVLGQLACAPLIERMARRSRARVGAIMTAYRLDPDLDRSITVRHVGSVNSKACRDALRDIAPAAVAVFGTRLIRRETLGATQAPFIGYHPGIAPMYRGQHPGYWALANGDAEHAGITVHLLDEGLATGRVLYQARVAFAPEDDITTYPWLQLAYGLPLLGDAIEDARAGGLQGREVHLRSRQWFAPTLWDYAWNGVTRGIW